MQALAKNFVCVADEVFRLHKGKLADSDFFRGFCEEGHYGGRTHPSDTRQGIYAVSADGSFLASVNTRRAEGMVRMLEQALARYEKLPDERRVTPPAMRARLEKVRRSEDAFPADGLVLRVSSRDLPGAKKQRSWHAGARNLDWAWFKKSELAGLVPERDGESWEAGARREVPRALVLRLARNHLIDNVRGQTSAFSARDVEKAALAVRVVAVADEGKRVELAYEGRTRAVQEKGKWARGFVSELRGRAVWLPGEQRFESFVLLAEAKRWGRTRFNSRESRKRRDPDEGVAKSEQDAEPLVVLFELLPDDKTDRVSPAFFWNYGW